MSISIIVAIVKLDNGGLDLIYTLLIANVLIGIATFIVLWSYISTHHSNLYTGIHWLLTKRWLNVCTKYGT